jgi:hypothetical protein
MIQIAGIAGLLLCFLISSVFIMKDRVGEAAAAGAASVIFLLLAVVDWSALKAWWNGLLARVAPSEKAAGSSPRRAGKAAAKAAPAARPRRLGALTAGLKSGLQSALPRELSLEWNSYLALTVGLLVLGQALIFVLSRTWLGWLITAAAIALGTNFAFSQDDKFRLKLVSTLPALAGTLALGIVLEAAGFVMGWWAHPYWAFFLILPAAVVLTFGLWRFWELPAREAEAADERRGLDVFALPESFTTRSTLFKAACFTLAACLFIFSRGMANFEQAFLMNIAATGVLLLSFPLFNLDITALDRLSPALRRTATLALLAGALLLGGLAQRHVYAGEFSVGLPLFLLAIIMVVAAVPAPSALETAENGRPGSLELGLFTVLMLAGAFLRIYRVSEVPCGVEGDEAGYAIWCEEMLFGKAEQIFIHYNQSLYWYWGGVPMLKWFGWTQLGVRAHSVYHGILGLASTYMLLRLFFNWRTALATVGFLAVGTWHLHFSRFGHYNVSTTFAQGVLFYFLFRAAIQRSLRDFVLAGLGLSIAAQTHVAARLIPIFLTAFLVYLFALHRRAFMKLLPGIMIVVACSWVLLSGPWIKYAHYPTLAFGRIQEVSIGNENNSNAPADMVSGLSNSFKASMLMFNFRGDYRTRDNFLAPEPMLDKYTAVLWVLGFGLCVYWWKRALFGFTLLAFFGTLAGSYMSVESPQSLRTAGNITFVFMMVGFIIDRLRWAVEEPLGAKRGKWVFLLLAAVGLGFAGYANISAYFNLGKTATLDSLPTYIGLKAQELGPESRVAFMSEWFGSGHPPVIFFSKGTPTTSQGEITPLLPARSAPPKGYYYAFSDRYKAAINYPMSLYPDGEAMNVDDPQKPGQTYFDGWWVKSEILNKSFGLNARYSGGGQTLAQVDEVLSGEGKAPAWATRGTWEGSLYSTAYADAKVYLDTKGQGAVWINGRQVSSTSNGKPDARIVRLPAGVVTVKATWSGSGDPGRLTWDRSVVKPNPGQGYFDVQPGDAGKQVVGHGLTYNKIKPMGLLQHFHAGQNFEGPALVKVDPLLQGHWVSGGYGNFSWRWTGWIHIKEAGTYDFRLNGAAYGDVLLNGRLINRVGPPHEGWKTQRSAPSGPQRLAPGRYPVEVLFGSPGGVDFQFEWINLQNGGAWKLVPAEAMEPEPYLG